MVFEVFDSTLTSEKSDVWHVSYKLNIILYKVPFLVIFVSLLGKIISYEEKFDLAQS